MSNKVWPFSHPTPLTQEGSAVHYSIALVAQWVGRLHANTPVLAPQPPSQILQAAGKDRTGLYNRRPIYNSTCLCVTTGYLQGYVQVTVNVVTRHHVAG